MKKYAAFNKSKSGFTLVEVLLVFIIVLVGGAFVYGMYNHLSGSSKVSQTQQSITAMSASIHGLYNGSSSYAGLSNNTAIVGGAVPQHLIKGSSIVTPWGGAITVAPSTNNTTFSISLADLGQKDCVAMATYEPESWVSVSVNGTGISKDTAVSGATTNCLASGNTVAFVAR